MEIHTKYATLAALMAILQTTINCQNNFLLRAALEPKRNVRRIHFPNSIPEKNGFACQNKTTKRMIKLLIFIK